MRYDVAALRGRLSHVGLLRSNALAEKTWTSYRKETAMFLDWLGTCDPQPSCAESLDLFVVRYCEIRYDDDPRRGCRQSCVNSMCGLEFICAELSGSLRHTRQALRGWSRLVPARSPPPLSADLVMSLSGYFYGTQRPMHALAMQLAFACYLRAGELLSLTPGDVCFADDPRLVGYRSLHAGILIRTAKTGTFQFVALQDRAVVGALEAAVGATSCRAFSEPLFGISYAQLSSALKEALAYFGLDNADFTLHSLRHGGATRDYLAGTELSDIMVKGRWVSLSSCR